MQSYIERLRVLHKSVGKMTGRLEVAGKESNFQMFEKDRELADLRSALH